MSYKISQQDIDTVKEKGTPVVSGTMRYVIPLDKLANKFDFINPKDAGTEWGNQSLKGDGNDILLLNGLSKEQIAKIDDYATKFEQEKHKPISDMHLIELKQFMSYLSENGFNDVYCSDKQYMESSLTANDKDKRIGLYARNKDAICRAAVLPLGAVYSDGQKEQQANVEGALLIVPENGRAEDARITNVPEDYSALTGEKVTSLVRLKADMSKQKGNEIDLSNADLSAVKKLNFRD